MAGPITMQGQREESRHTTVDLTVEPAEYFGKRPEELSNAVEWGLIPTDGRDLYRVQYLYLMVFGNEKSSTDYGGIQVRGSTHLYLHDGRVPSKLQRVIQRIAHRGAFFFDSSIEEGFYGGGGGEWADGGGYLSGFTPVETGNDYRNWEVEPVPDRDAETSRAGVIEWTTEVYLEVDGTEYAELSGVAQGISNPWDVTSHYQERIEAQSTWWEVTWNSTHSGGSYDIHPSARTQSRERANEKLRGKDVYLNGLKIGTMTKGGRVWLKKQYDGGDTYRGSHSKASIVDKTSAAPQSVRGSSANPGKLAKVDESPGAVHLATKGHRPDDWEPEDPDEIETDRDVREAGWVHLLRLPDDMEDPTVQTCRQDRQVIRHLGYSNPPYSHSYARKWSWPGERTIEETGSVVTWEDRYGAEEIDGSDWVDDREVSDE